MLARSKEDAEEVAEAEPMPDEKPWENVSRPWSLLASPQSASAPLRESMEGVGEAISPDFCLTMPLHRPSSHACKGSKVRKGHKKEEQRKTDTGKRRGVWRTKKV